MPKITDDVTATIRYDFDTPVNQAEEEDVEDLELSEELARSIEQRLTVYNHIKNLLRLLIWAHKRIRKR